MSSVTKIMSLASTLSQNDMLVLNTELAQQLLLRQVATEADSSVSSAGSKVKRVMNQQFVITESGLAKGLTVDSHVYATSKQAHEAIHILSVMKDAGAVSKAHILEALEGTNFTALSKQSAKSLVDYWMKEFNKLEWIEEAE